MNSGLLKKTKGYVTLWPTLSLILHQKKRTMTKAHKIESGKYPQMLLDMHGIDWLYKSLPHYELLLDDKLKQSLFEGAFSSPIQLSDYVIKHRRLEGISAKQFFKQVLQHIEINTLERMGIVCKVINCSNNVEQLLDGISYAMHRYLRSALYREFVNLVFDNRRKVNVQWSDSRIKLYMQDQDRTGKVKYVGELQLPEECTLVTTEKRLWQEGTSMNNCLASYWKQIEERDSFIISMKKPERLSVEIRKNEFVELFQISEIDARLDEDRRKEVLSILNDCILSPESQAFFFANAFDAEVDRKRLSHYNLNVGVCVFRNKNVFTNRVPTEEVVTCLRNEGYQLYEFNSDNTVDAVGSFDRPF